MSNWADATTRALVHRITAASFQHQPKPVRVYVSPAAAEHILGLSDLYPARIVPPELTGSIGVVYGMDWLTDPELAGEDFRFDA